MDYKRESSTRRLFARLCLSLVIASVLAAPFYTSSPQAALSPEEAITAALAGVEVGPDDFRISYTGGDIHFDAFSPAVAYNPTANEYLVVWNGDEETDSEFEIYGQRINAATGEEVGPNDFRISNMGPDGNPDYDAYGPSVVYNPTEDEYLVVWQGDDNTAPLVDNEMEIFGQRLAGDGTEIGANDFRISNMGPNGNPNFDANAPVVVYNSTDNEYLVVWFGDHGFNDEYDVYGQRLSADGGEVGMNDFRISSMGPNNNINFFGVNPDVTYNSTDNEYLVVWYGDDDTLPLVDNEFEVFGQLLAADGSHIGANDFRISFMGPDGNTIYSGTSPSVAYNSTDQEYLVVWRGDDLIDDEYEIYGQRLAADGNELGTKGFRISNVGPAGDIDHEASTVNVVYNSSANEYLVSWSANDLLTDYEVYGQRLTAAGAEIGPDDFRISDMGPDGDDLYAASNPQIAYNSTDNEYFLVWDGDDQDLTLVDNEFEIFGQRVEADGTETGANDFRISDMGGDDTFAAFDARAAYNSSANEFLVVWIAKLWPTQEFEVMGQRVDASTADLLGENFRISDMGPDGNLVAYAFQPDVAYNATDNQYLVVWSGFDLPTSELEIYGQRLDASGAEIGVNDFRISDMGPNGAPMHSALEPTVVHNSVDNEYLVVWYGDDAVDNEAEIYGQRLDANGAEIGANDMRLTHMGPDDDTSYAALLPELAFNPDANQYLLVWVGNDSLPAEFEVYGRLLDHTATPLGPGHLRLSSMGPDGDANFQVFNFQTVYNSVTQEYVVVWDGDDSVDNFIEIFGQRLTASGEEIGPDDFTISAASPGNIGFFRTDYPKVTVSPHSGEALVSFRASLLSSPDDMEIFVQRLDLSGGLLGEAVQLSEMGPPGDGTFFALNNALAYNPQDDLILGTWTGVDDRSPMVNTDMEIFGQLYAIRVDLGLNGVIPAFVSPEVDVTVPLTVTNSGPDTALGLSLTVSLPPGVTFMSASGPGWTCGEAGGIVTCEADSLDVNTSAPLSLTVTSPASFGSFSIPVAITSGNTDLEQGDNSLLLTSQVTPGGQANHPLYLPITLRP